MTINRSGCARATGSDCPVRESETFAPHRRAAWVAQVWTGERIRRLTREYRGRRTAGMTPAAAPSGLAVSVAVEDE